MTLTGKSGGEAEGVPAGGSGPPRGAASDAGASEAVEGLEGGSERDYDFADDEDSDGEEEEEEEEDLMEDTDEEEEEEEGLRSSEEEAIDELQMLRERKKLYEMTKKKQRQLIEKYFESIEKLKKVRMKNMFLQDRIHQHLVEKSKILIECREAVRVRQEMMSQLEAEETRPQMTHHQFEGLQRQLDREACGDAWEHIEEDNSPEEEEEEEDDDATVVKFDEDYRRNKKCKKQAKEYKKKHEKGLSKLERLSIEHYHFDRLHHHEHRKKKDEHPPPPEHVEVVNKEEDKQTSGKNEHHDHAGSISGRLSPLEVKPSETTHKNQLAENQDLEKIRQEELREEAYGDGDADDEWKIKNEKEREAHRKAEHLHKHEAQLGVGHHNQPSDHSELQPQVSKIILDEDTMNADMTFIYNQEAAGKKKIVLPSHADAPVDPDEHKRRALPSLNPVHRTASLQEHHERINLRNMCRARKFRLQGIQRERLEEFRETQATIIKVDKDDDEISEEEAGLPDFTFQMSDLSLTNMTFGENLRSELESMIRKTKIPINLDWPLALRGFKEHFQKPNAYGRIVYTMRSDVQIKATKKTSRKYKYVLHNLNYMRQQKSIMKEVHQDNMEYFEVSKNKWEDALEQLLMKVLNEIREAALEAVDASGRGISQTQVDHWCRDVIKDFENLDNTAKIFYRMMNSVAIVIRDLIHSESRGEGVEMQEYKSLLRTNETVGAHFYQKQYVLEEYKQRCRDLDAVYMKTLTKKENAAQTVTDKYQLSGELSCLLVPKQKAMKFTEFKAKRLVKENDTLVLKSGITPYPSLVMDYENIYTHIESRRHVRMDLQLKYNSRVRQVHKIYDNMEEVQRLIPEDFNKQWPIQYDSCGLRPKTAPPSTFQRPKTNLFSKSTTTLAKAKSNFLTQQESHAALEKAELNSRRIVNFGASKPNAAIDAIKDTIIGRPKTSVGGRTSVGLLTTVPRPATAATTPTSPIGPKKTSILKQQSDVLNVNENHLSFLIASEEAKSKEKFKRNLIKEGILTPSTTGILPKVTATALLRDTNPRKVLIGTKGTSPGQGKTTTFQKPPGQGIPSLSRPFTAPPRKLYESETKNWPYRYFMKKSPVLEQSKRKMDTVLGIIESNKKPGDPDLF